MSEPSGLGCIRFWRAPQGYASKHNFEPLIASLCVPVARKRRSPESIANVLREAESGIPIAELACKTGLDENTIHAVEKKYYSLGTSEIREILRTV